MNTTTFGKIIGGAALTLAAAAPACATNLLTNPGFETGDFTGWTVAGAAANGVATLGTPVAAYFPGKVNVRSGNYAAYGLVRGNCCTTPEPIVLSQTLTVTPFDTLNIGFYASNWSSSSVGAAIENAPNGVEIYVDGTAIVPATGYFLFNNDASWDNFAGTFVNGAASTITVEFQFVASGYGNFPVSLDDFYVNGVAPALPEPSSLLLAGLAMIGLAQSRIREGKDNS